MEAEDIVKIIITIIVVIIILWVFIFYILPTLLKAMPEIGLILSKLSPKLERWRANLLKIN